MIYIYGDKGDRKGWGLGVGLGDWASMDEIRGIMVWGGMVVSLEDWDIHLEVPAHEELATHLGGSSVGLRGCRLGY